MGERNGSYEGRRQDGGKRNRGSVGGKAKQVYVEKRRKQKEEEWERKKKRYGNKGESSISKKRPSAWWGLNFLGQTHKPNRASKKKKKTPEMRGAFRHLHSNT